MERGVGNSLILCVGPISRRGRQLFGAERALHDDCSCPKARQTRGESGACDMCSQSSWRNLHACSRSPASPTTPFSPAPIPPFPSLNSPRPLVSSHRFARYSAAISPIERGRVGLGWARTDPSDERGGAAISGNSSCKNTTKRWETGMRKRGPGEGVFLRSPPRAASNLPSIRRPDRLSRLLNICVSDAIASSTCCAAIWAFPQPSPFEAPSYITPRWGNSSGSAPNLHTSNTAHRAESYLCAFPGSILSNSPSLLLSCLPGSFLLRRATFFFSSLKRHPFPIPSEHWPCPPRTLLPRRRSRPGTSRSNVHFVGVHPWAPSPMADPLCVGIERLILRLLIPDVHGNRLGADALPTLNA